MFWTIPTDFIDKARAGQGITAINLLGNIGGLLGPCAIGSIGEATGSFEWPAHAMAAAIFAGALVPWVAFHRRADETKRLGRPGTASGG